MKQRFFIIRIFIWITVLFYSCEKESTTLPAYRSDPPPKEPSEIMFNGLIWEQSPGDSGVALKLPPLPSQGLYEKIEKLLIFDRELYCVAQPTGGTYCFYFGTQWILVEKNGVEKGKTFYRLDNFSITLYVKSSQFVYGVFYKERRDDVKVVFLK